MIDKSRFYKTANLGTYDVDPAASFEAGAPLKLTAAGLGVATAGGADFFGVASHDKVSALIGVVIEEQVVLTGTVAHALAHADLVATQIKVTSADGLTTYTEGATAAADDYYVNDTNGTIQRSTTPSTIGDGDIVLVTYRYNLTTDEINRAGRNFDNTLDDTQGSGKISLLQSYASFFTTNFDASAAFTLGGALTVGASGTYKPKGGGDTKVATCVSVPTPADPFLGVQIG